MAEQSSNPPPLSGKVSKHLGRIIARGSLGLWVQAVFVAASIGAHRNFWLPPYPDAAHLPPSALWSSGLISVALVLYTFGATVRILSRMAFGYGKYDSWGHLAVLGGFYGFYYFAGTLADNFWAVFAAGMTVLSLESYHIWSYHRALFKEMEKFLLRLENRGGEDE